MHELDLAGDGRNPSLYITIASTDPSRLRDLGLATLI